MKKVLIASGVAVLAFAMVAGAATYAFQTNLTVGSTGADVSALQSALISAGYSIPAIASGAAQKGYFGSQTQTAVKAFQAANGVRNTGFVGPLTLRVLNGTTVAVAPAVGCPVGFTCTANNGTAVIVPPSQITTPGVEGILSVSQGAIPNTTIYVGNQKAPVISLALQAQSSDISVQRVQLDLGNNSAIYTKQLSTLYVLGDNGAVLASTPLNTSTVSKANNEYYVTITGFNFIVPKNSPNRYLTIAADVWPSVDTTYRSPILNTTVALAPNGVRGVDGAGIDQYSGIENKFSQITFINSSLTDSADIKISTNSSNAASGAVTANSGPNNDQSDKLTTLIFDIKAEKDNVGITQIVASTTVDGVARNGTTTAAYLYDNSTLIASAAIGLTGVATFSNINGSTGYVIAANTSKAFTIKVDVRQASVNPAIIVTTIIGVTAQNSQGSNLIGGQITGSAYTPNSLAVQKSGAIFALVGVPTVSKSVIGTTASSTFSTAFTVSVSAQGNPVIINATGAFVIGVYVNGSQVTTVNGTYEKPASGVSGSGPYTIADGSIATFAVKTSFIGPNGLFVPAGGIVTTRIESINGSNTYVSDTFRASTDGPGNTITL